MFVANISNVIVALTIILNTAISAIVYLRNRRSATNILFSLLGVTILIWLVTTMISFQPLDEASSLFWIRFSTFFAPLICFFFLTFAHTVPNPKIQMKTAGFFILLFSTYLIMLLIISPFTFVKVTMVNNFPNPAPGVGMIPFMIFVGATIGSSIFILVKKLRRSSGIARHQIRLIILGIISMPGLILLTNVIPILIFQNNSLVPFTPLLTLSFIAITGYAIVKHRFFDIRFIIARSVSYSILIAFFGIFYSFLFGVFSSFFTIQNIQAKTVTVSAVLALIMTFSFQTVKRFIEKYTDRFLYQDRYDTSQLLYDLTLIMASTLKFEDLSHQFLKTLIAEMRVSKGAIILANDDKIYDVIHEGYSKTPEYSEKKVFSLIKQNRIIVFDELPEDETKRIMRDMGIFVAVNINTAGEQIGLLTLGEKLSGDIYSVDDIRVIEIIEPEVAVAIKNALSYDEISKFNLTLKEEIDQATADLRNANKKLKELDKLKDEFVSVASHELRTPMTAIKNYLWLALENEKGANKEVAKDLNIAYSSTERLLKLVEDMLTVSRIEGKRLVLKTEAVVLDEVIKQVYDEFTVIASPRKITLNFTKGKKQITVKGDKEKLREVIQNILGNAIKFTPDQGLINIKLAEKDSVAVIEIFNSGSFISKEDADKLFEKFRRIETSGSGQSPVKGTGLGLYISRQLVKYHKGKIEVKSEKGRGTSFIISLPKQDVDKK